MSQQIVFTSYVPTSLVGNNSASKTLAAEVVTGLPIPTGAVLGQAFFLSEAWANQLSAVAINSAPVLQCHAGWYMVVKLDAGATAANVAQGSIGAQLSLAAGRNDITDMAHVLGQGFNPVVFLNAVTPGNYSIVQLSGDATVVLAASQTVAVSTVLVSDTTGFAEAAGAISDTVYPTIIGISEQAFNSPAGALTLTAVAASSGGSAVYTGTITGGTTPNYVGNSFVIAGFTKGVNNGTFLCTACSTTTLTLSNPGAVAETHAGTATATNLIRCALKTPFGGI